MVRLTTAVSIRGDRRYVKALNKFAEEEGKSTGELLREIVDSAIGIKLQPYIDSLPERVYIHRRKNEEVDTEEGERVAS